MPWYNCVLNAINAAAPFLVATQATNLALLISAILKKRTLCLSELARAYPTPEERKTAAPKHDLLHRLKRLWRFIENERVDALATQVAFVPHVVARLGHPRWLGLAIDWTMFDTKLPSGKRMRYQVLRIAIPRKGRALPLLQLAYDRDAFPANKSQNQLEQDALFAVVRALPSSVRPVVLADRGFGRAGFLSWLQRHDLDFVVRLSKGGCITEADGSRWKLGEERLGRGQLRCLQEVRYGLYHGRPRDLFVNLALCWKMPKCRARDPRRKQPEEPWYLATSLKDAQSAASWYWQRGWIEQSFKDSKGRFGLAEVMVGCPKRLSRLLVALTVALGWLTLMGLPEVGVMPKGWHAAVAQRGRASVISLALALLDKLGDLPSSCLPRSSVYG
ncbi:MAG: transposase [Actinobacteria bacterium]|nr:transposase [Actinomycetota bacterium]